MRGLLALLLLVFGSTAAARAQVATPAAAGAPAPGLSVTLVTFGQGVDVFERFGHDALWFQDPATGESSAYHWGLFNFTEPGFVARFVAGEPRYSMGGEDAVSRIDYERRTGRTVTLQRLALTPAQAHALLDFVRWNALPQNRYYRYDYFRDNCATRLRDALDRALGGALKAQFDRVPTALTYRSESVRLTDGDRPAQLGIDLALGTPADRPLTEWETFFIPMRMRDAIRDVTVAGAGGARTPLVLEERVLPMVPDAPRVTERATVPRLTWRYLVCGLVLAAFVIGLRVMMVTRRGAAWGLALVGAAWWLVWGIVGLLIAYAWAATQHVFWARNEHLLLLSPVCLLLVVLTPMALLRGRSTSAARACALLAAGLGLVAALLAIIPGGQASAPVVALVLPVHLALAWAITRAGGATRARVVTA
jgi:hypothetical protein